MCELRISSKPLAHNEILSAGAAWQTINELRKKINDENKEEINRAVKTIKKHLSEKITAYLIYSGCTDIEDCEYE